ncbi:ABC transporter ATP-binding protein [Brooklawnia sp.]|uniref:ABC transporter ATP-binding protein n=1 Tax=Brooklawnia sp. TaxID=2699740 RepID=UPI00311EB657
MIRFENVSFSYDSGGAESGVSEIDFEVAAGECVLFCGASGSGKTTIAKLANGLAPDFIPGQMSGRILVDGRDLAELESWERARLIGSVFQNPRTQFFNTDVAGEVAFAMECLAWPGQRLRSRTSEVMSALELASLADRSIFSLSGGERQRVAFASAYAAMPGNYVLDEPTSNLDARATDHLAEYVRLAKAEGASTLVAEHRLYWLSDCVDTVVWLRDGRIGQVFTRDEFWALDAGERAAMGLRCTDLDEVAWSTEDRYRPLLPVERSLLGSGGQSHEDDAASASGYYLEAESLTASYRGNDVLTGIDFAARSGEVIAVTGLNGAGKTTLTRLISGLHKNGGGTLRWGDQPLTRKNRLKVSAMVFQDVNYQLFADSVLAEVTFGLDQSEPDLAIRLLADLGLADLAERHPATLSGGQKQRLAVTSCIAAGKQILTFDEPTSGLDLTGMDQVATLVKKVAAAGNLVFVVTHDLEFIARACTRVLHIADGRLQLDATPHELPIGHLAALLGGQSTSSPQLLQARAADPDSCSPATP